MNRHGTRHPAPIYGRILGSDGREGHQRELDPIRWEHSDIVDLMLAEREFIRKCRQGGEHAS